MSSSSQQKRITANAVHLLLQTLHSEVPEEGDYVQGSCSIIAASTEGERSANAQSASHTWEDPEVVALADLQLLAIDIHRLLRRPCTR